ncbi:MAG: arginine--tRNA ligase [Patescibacteria group bacterium]|nr:arginine--tRNA ligase [Patescibacteria group bacterium]
MKMRKKNQDEFENYKLEVAESVNAVQEKIREEKENREYVDFDSYPSEELRREVTEVVRESVGVQDIGKLKLSVPPAHISGDFALKVFDLAKKLGEKPNVLAKKIVDGINEHKMALIKNASVAGNFVNLETHKEVLYRDIFAKVLELEDRYGESDVNAGKVALIDYSAPNIAKPMGVGHLRSTIIGQALSNIYHETGYSVIKDNHLGDWGTQFGSLIYAYKEWGDEKKIAKNPVGELKDLYVKFHQFSEVHPEIKDKARELFTRLEKKDPELVALWKRFRDLSLKDFERVYKQLGIEFDTNIGESYFTEQADKLVSECMTKGLCRKDEASEAVVVDQMGEIPSFLLRKQDGSSIYLSRDLATLLFRVNTFKPSTILYVVGNEQDLNFKQLFELGKRAEYLPDDVETKHIGFGMVLSDGKKMSTRKGTQIELEDLIARSVEKSKEILLKKKADVDSKELERVSEIIGIGAIIYNDLHQSRLKNISFNWDKMLDMESGSAVYLQYSYVRINSILRKLTKTYGEIDLSTLEKEKISFTNKSEFDIAKKLMMFPETVLISQQTDSPHKICVYLEELAQLFNSFYNEVSIFRTKDVKLRESRIALSKGVAAVIKKGLSLLSIKVPEKM